ncbi:MAG: hypothetical protein JWN04_6379 [Myxococcaceae bacterium]|nr:hypothetical protein [Myxococcaceae bacterium]
MQRTRFALWPFHLAAQLLLAPTFLGVIGIVAVRTTERHVAFALLAAVVAVCGVTAYQLVRGFRGDVEYAQLGLVLAVAVCAGLVVLIGASSSVQVADEIGRDTPPTGTVPDDSRSGPDAEGGYGRYRRYASRQMELLRLSCWQMELEATRELAGAQGSELSGSGPVYRKRRRGLADCRRRLAEAEARSGDYGTDGGLPLPSSGRILTPNAPSHQVE